MLILLGLAFVLNVIWEEAHHVLYVAYQGGDITQVVLWRAAVADALITGALFGPLLFFEHAKQWLWISAGLALLVAIGIERFALSTDRWAYASTMPIIPLLQTGLTPTIQLALLGVFAFWIATKRA